MTGLEDIGQFPTISWVRRFAERHNLTLRKASIISKGRAVISPQDITLWFKDIEQFFTSNLEIKEALLDPRRVFNQDETAIEHGVGNMYVLAMKGEKQVYGVSSSTRDHTTISFTVNAAGGMVEPRVISPGVRDIAKNKMKLPTNGRTGMWRYSYTSNGWVNQEIFIDILMDLVRYIKNQDILLPVVLFIDRASCHLSIDMAEFCKLN